MCKLNNEQLVFFQSEENFCLNDELLISKTGDESLSDAERYCGVHHIHLYCDSGLITIGTFLKSDVYYY